MVILRVFFATLCILNFVLGTRSISCRTENGRHTDWYVNYKLPKLEDHGNTLIGKGEAYAYLVSNSRLEHWRLSDVSITSTSSMLGKTLDAFYNAPDRKKISYLLYNDDAPGDSGTGQGHTKGVVVFDGSTGIWIVHSIPKFAAVSSYEYPSNGFENGQSVLCVTFNSKELNEIGKQLLYNAPYIYASHLSHDVGNLLDDDVKSLFTDKPSYIRSPPFSRITPLKSKGRLVITSFAKDNQFGKDLYSSLIAPELEADLFVETWRRGSGTPLDPSCSVKYQVQDVTSIGFTVANKSSDVRIEFSSSEDHSKWAISQDKHKHWVCIGDINRMASQEKRGGGSLCFQSKKAWNAYYTGVAETDDC